MKFSIAGTGNMAWFLAHRLIMSGHQCVSVYGRNKAKAEELASAVNSKAIVDPSEVKALSQEAVIIAVSDNAIAEVAHSLAAPNVTLVHTSGATELNVLSGVASHGVIWPVYSILKHQLPDHRQIPCAIAASDTHALSIVQNIAHGFSDVVFEADDLQRRWLHLAAVMGNNFINHLLAVCNAICDNQSLPYSVLQPILTQTFKRTQTASPALLQTGPAIRHDVHTIQKHLSLLGDHPQWQRLYQALTESIQNSESKIGTENPVKD